MRYKIFKKEEGFTPTPLRKMLGFTVIEVLVSITIFIIIMTIVLINYGQGENSSTFRLQAFDLEDFIRNVQSMSLSGKKIEGKLPINGYGLFLDKNSEEIIVFGDMDNNNSYTSGDLTYSNEVLNKNINFNKFDIFCDGFVESPDILELVFIPPKPTMLINDDSTCTSSIIYLESEGVEGIWSILFESMTGRTWTIFSE